MSRSDAHSGLVVVGFAGGGGSSLGIEQALRRPIDIGINHDPAALAIHKANHPLTEHYSKNIWQIDPRDAVFGRPVELAWFSPDCFPAGTLVLTERGYVAIETVDVGEMVLTHLGRWRPVTATMTTMRPVMTLRGHGHPGLRVSPEHPFYARQRKLVWDNSIRRSIPQHSDPAWTKAAKLGPGAYRYVYDNGNCAELDGGWYWASPASVAQIPIPELQKRHGGAAVLPIDERLMWLAGRYVGDGWTRLTETRGELVIICGAHEADEAARALDLWPRTGDRVLDGELAWSRRDLETAVQFSANSRALVAWLRENFGHGAGAKKFPAWVFGMSPKLQWALLEGYLSADGWRGSDHRGHAIVSASTVSRALAFSLKTLLVILGFAPAVYLQAKRETNVIEGRVVNVRPSYMVKWREMDERSPTFVDEGFRWTPIKDRIEPAGEEIVFNLAVEEDESYVVEGILVHNCTDHSKAKGGRPVRRHIRDLAWVVVSWAKFARPRLIFVENVEEFRDWGPVDRDGMRCPERRGETFKRWVAELRRLGYRVEWRELRACDYGAPTIRKRLFLIARRDGEKIVWPETTHGPFRAQPYSVAADIIDWSLPCPSIFLTREEGRAIGVNRPLAEATMRRIARGIRRYVLDAAEPFIVPLTHQGSDRVHGTQEPLRTITTAHRGELAVVAPYFVQRYGERPEQEPRTRPVTDPIQTVVPSGNGAQMVSAYLSPYYGERRPGETRAHRLEDPLATQTTENRFGLVAAFLAQHNGGMVGHDAREPVSTVTVKGSHQQLVAAHMLNLKGADRRSRGADEPLATVCAGGWHAAEVRAFLIKWYGTDQDPRLEDPLHTVTTRDRFGLVTVEIAGEPWLIADIGMRMLTPRELFSAQGFPPGYIIDPELDGKPLTKTAQIRAAGNSVCPPVAAALVRANCAWMTREEQAA